MGISLIKVLMKLRLGGEIGRQKMILAYCFVRDNRNAVYLLVLNFILLRDNLNEFIYIALGDKYILGEKKYDL